MSLNHDSGEFEWIEKSPPGLEKFRKWLQPTEYDASSSEFRRHLGSQAPGTGKWVQELDQYQKWHDSPENGFIWIKGVAGAGKSVVAASMVETLTQESIPVLHFFFRQIIETNRTSRSLVRDWLCQLLPASEALRNSLWPLVKEDSALSEIATNELWQYLLDGLRSVERVYCIVDALDEMDVDQEFFSKLNALGSFRPGHVKVLVTSRPKQYLQRALIDPAVIHVSLEEERVSRDIRKFVEYRTSSLDMADEIRLSVVETVSQRSQGLFLYARLMLDDLAAADPATLPELVDRLPTGLEEMYNNILLERAISTGIDERVQLQILQLVTQSARPLRLIEIAKAIERHNLVEDNGKEIVRTACGPLLEIMEDEVVQILHHSFTEFLMDSGRMQPGHQFPVIDPAQANGEIALLCLRYLMDGVFDNYIIPKVEPGARSFRRGCSQAPEFDFQPILLKYPFARYAADKWTYHAKAHGGSDELLQTILQFSEEKFYAGWVDLMSNGQVRDEALSFTPLHASARFGLLFWTKHLIQTGADLNARDSVEQTPMKWAAENGHEDMVALLIENGAKPDVDGIDGWKPMHHAAIRNHPGVIRLLLQAGVSPTTPRPREIRGWCGNQPRRTGEHPLMYASRAGHTKIVIEMLPYLEPRQVEEALCWAAEGGHVELMQALFDKSDVSPNAELRIYRDLMNTGTALLLACESLEPRCVEILLQKGADVNGVFTLLHGNVCYVGGGPKQRNKDTALHALASQSKRNDGSWDKIFRALLAAGADLEARDGEERTPFLRVFRRNAGDSGCLPKFQSFQKAGANLCAVDKNGKNALFQAVESGRKESVICLLDWIDASLAATNGSTPLHYGVSLNNMDRIDILRELVSRGASVNAVNEDGDTALHLLCRLTGHGRFEKVCYLLENGANVNLRNNLGQTCLYKYTIPSWKQRDKHGDEATLRALIEKAHISQGDAKGRTVLHYAITNNVTLLELLLRLCPKSLLSTCANGKTTLHVACQADTRRPSPARIVQTLLDHGAGISTDDTGKTLLHEAAVRFQGGARDIGLVKKLLDLVPMDAPDSRGQTALHVVPEFCSERDYGHQSLVDVLKKRNPHLDVNPVDNDGFTPLHYASGSESETFRLIRSGADVNARNKFLQTPLHLAARSRSDGVVAMLLHFGAESSEDADGKTPLFEACRAGCPEAVAALVAAGSKPSPQIIAEAKQREAIGTGARSSEILALLGVADLNLEDNRKRIEEFSESLSTILAEDKEFHSRSKRPLLHTLIPDLTVSDLEKIIEQGVDFTKAHTLYIGRHCVMETPLGVVLKTGRRDLMAKLISQAILLDDIEYRSKVGSNQNGIRNLTPVIREACARPNNNLDMIKLLVSSGLDVNARGQRPKVEDGIRARTALHVLARGDYWWQIEAIKFLIESGADLEATDEWGRTALHVANDKPEDRTELLVKPCTFQRECSKLLLAGGANPNSLDGRGRSVLSLTKDLDAARALLEHGADVNLGKKGAMMTAIEAKDVDLLKLYVKHGADCNYPDKVSEYPLVINMYPLGRVINNPDKTLDPSTREEMLQILLDHGARLDLPLEKGPMIHYFVRESKPAALQPLFSKPYFDPDLRDNQGSTVFLSACDSWRGSEDTPTFSLLANSEYYECDYLAVDHKGRNMLMYLVRKWNSSIAELVTQFVSPHLPQLLAQKDHEGNSCLHQAIKEDRYDAGLYFFQHGANVLEANNAGDTVLHLFFCAERQDQWPASFVPVLEAFLHGGGSIDCRNKQGRTPVHAYVSGVNAAYVPVWRYFPSKSNDKDKYLDFLASNSADFLAKDNRGQSILHLIANRRCSNMITVEQDKAFNLTLFKRFVTRGCDPLTEDGEGSSALDIAAATGNTKILEAYQRTRMGDNVRRDE